MSAHDLNFRYLNREARWRDFTWDRLDLHPDGALTLAALPLLSVDPPAALTTLPDPSGPAGIAADSTGRIYFSGPDENTIAGLNACESLASPRGLAFSAKRAAIFVCDSANHRVLIVHRETSQLLETWEDFHAPVGVALQRDAAVFIVDRSTKIVSKYGLDGVMDRAFSAAVRASGAPLDPVSIAVAPDGTVFVLDAAKPAVLVFDAAGKSLSSPAQWLGLTRPMGLAVTADSIYVGDNGLRRVLRFRNAPGHTLVGEAAGYQGPVAALGIAANGDLLIHSGSHTAPLALRTAGAFTVAGTMVSSALHASERSVAWHSLHAETGDLRFGAHIQFYFRISDNPAPVSFPSAAWTAAPRDLTDVYLGGTAGRYLWIAVRFSGNGTASPILSQLKVRFDQETYFPYLPAIYNAPAPERDLVAGLLGLFESFNVEEEQAIEALPELFDAAAPADALPWLASWLMTGLDQHWSTAKQRIAVAEAYNRNARRGTVAGLLEAVKFETGQNVLIEEPIQHTSWWALPPASKPCGVVSSPDELGGAGGARLGIGTMLSGPGPDGAVIGSAVLDRSRILDADSYGLPLFDEVAHRFCVYLYRGTQSAHAARVARVVDREKPAHTSFHMCTIEPCMRIGFQARVGIDTVIGGPAEPSLLGSPESARGFSLDRDNVIRIGVHSRVGDQLRL
jgi:phage tail-like protein